MEEIIRLALFYLAGIWRYRWFTLAIAAVICPIGWAYVATMPDEYEASARVFVDTQSVLNPLLKGLTVETDDSRRIRMMTSVLFSRENMEKLARMTDLDLRAKTPRQMDDLVSDLKSRVRLDAAGDNIYTINFEDAKPDLAKRVVQSMLTMFVESNLGDSRQDQDSAEQFLRREIKSYEQRLDEADRRRKDFKASHMDVLSQKGGYYERLTDARHQLAAAQEQLELSTKRKDELSAQLKAVGEEGYNQWVDESAQTIASPTEDRIKDLQKQLDDLLLKYTDRHPDVIVMRETIARLKIKAKKEREEYLAAQKAQAASDEQTSTANANNSVYQQMRLVLSQAQADIAAQQAKVAALTKQVTDLGHAIDEGLKVDLEEKQLNRDYGVLQSNYHALTQRLEQARLTRQVDTSVDTVRFRVLDPPKVPQKPSGPNRILLSSAVFGVALLAGLGIAFLLAQVRPVFEDRRQLNEALGMPVLGSINMIWTDTEKKKRRVTNFAFAGGTAALVAAYALVIAVFVLDLNPLAKLVV
jgi:polysaccharide chain length determinant protein (PEP-CTERM system associated)